MKNRSTGRLGRLFLNAVTLEGRCPGSIVIKQESGRDPGLRHSRMTLFDNAKATACGAGLFCKGFTLIELLVVVLIIGILAAIALPQYRVAVERARVAKALPVLRSILDARERSFMANGVYSADLDELDIQIPYQFKKEVATGIEYNGTPIRYFKLSFSSNCVFWSSGNVTIDFCSYRKQCYGRNDLGDRVCSSFGKKVGTASNGHPLYALDF